MVSPMSLVRFRLGNIYLSNLTNERGILCATQPSIVICKFLHGMTSSNIFGWVSEASHRLLLRYNEKNILVCVFWMRDRGSNQTLWSILTKYIT